MMFYLVPLVIAATIVSMSLVCKSLPMPDKLVKEQQQLTDNGYEQQEYACLLERNETVRREFEHSLRVKHGINDRNYGRFPQNQLVHAELYTLSSDSLSRKSGSGPYRSRYISRVLSPI